MVCRFGSSESRGKVDENRMNELTYMDCWHFVSYIIPTNTKTNREIYCMVYRALKEAEERRIAKKRKEKPKDEKN